MGDPPVIPWAAESIEGWAAALTAQEQGEAIVTLKGNCPRCGHPTTVTIQSFDSNPGFGAAAADLLRRRAQHRLPDEIVAICHCGSAHPGAPAGKDGCGAYGGIGLKQTG